MSSFLTKVIKNNLTKKSTLSSLNYCTASTSTLWEPDYLQAAKKLPPVYEAVNFQLKGYDFVTLEKYQGLIHKLAKRLGFTVADTWSTPCKDLKVSNLKAKSSVVRTEYLLHEYERNVQISHAEGYKLSLLIDLAATTCPPGVKVSVHKHLPEMTEIRHVPDFDVLELEAKLEEVKKNFK